LVKKNIPNRKISKIICYLVGSIELLNDCSFVKLVEIFKKVNDLKKVAIIGAGNIGSRHLQALKNVSFPLDITVIDPNPESLKIAKERYDSIPLGKEKHTINYLKNIEKIHDEFEVAIIATHSNIRRMVIEQLLAKYHIKSFILEKILFNKTEDYSIISDLLKDHNCQAWVNCTRRTIPFYKDTIKNWFNKDKLIFVVSGSQWNLISNLIHFVDYMAYIIGNDEFSIDFKHLNLNSINSRIPNFIEFNGTIQVFFYGGSIGIINCYPTGKQPIIIDIASATVRCIMNEAEGKTWVNLSNDGIDWEVHDSKILYTSQLTTNFVEDIIKNNTCALTSYKESMKLHLQIFEPLLKYLNENLTKKFTDYPFT